MHISVDVSDFFFETVKLVSNSLENESLIKENVSIDRKGACIHFEEPSARHASQLLS